MDDNPFVVFQVRERKDETIHLSGYTANDAFLAFFGFGSKKRLRKRKAQDIFMDYLPQVDEWTEFALRAYKMPNSLNARGIGDSSFRRKRLIQYFDHYGWMMMDLLCQTDYHFLCITFYPADIEKASIGINQFVEQTQRLWLGDFTASGGDMENGGTWEIDYASGKVFISRSFAQIMNIGENSMVISLDQLFSSIYYKDIQVMLRMIDNLHGESGPVVIRNMLPGGRIIYLQSFARPLLSRQGKVVSIIGNSRDITQRVLDREKLVFSEERFRRIVENTTDLFFIVDQYGRYKYVSPNIQRALGIPAADVQGKLFGMYLEHYEDARAVRKTFCEVMETKRPAKIQYRVRDAEGRFYWCLSSISAVPDDTGESFEAIVIGKDVTEERNHREEASYIGTHDTLTGAYNRFHFEQELGRIRREEICDVCMLMVDINGLKVINDAFGHRMGDRILMSVSSLMRNLPYGGDVFRVGGDEFILLLYDTELIAGEKIGEEICRMCNELVVENIPFSVSCGVACRRSCELGVEAFCKLAESRLYNNKLRDDNSMHSQIVASLGEAMRHRNLETAEHVQRVERMIVALDKRLRLSKDAFNRMALLASMHDIGKLAIPDSIINKPGKLTDDEWAIMRNHCEVGYRIAMASLELSEIAREILYHHERWDGTGYPHGKKGEDIPLLSRILSVVDTYDVITHKRVYKDSFDHGMAIEEIKRCSGTQFDPTIVSMFLEIFEDMPEEETALFAGDKEPADCLA